MRLLVTPFSQIPSKTQIETGRSSDVAFSLITISDLALVQIYDALGREMIITLQIFSLCTFE
jgi:hypothetical protein